MNARDKRRIREIREKIVAKWPEIETAPDIDDVLKHLPQDEDIEAMLSALPCDIDLPQLSDDVPDLDLLELTDYSLRILDAIGDNQRRKPRRKNKKSHESRFVRPPRDIARDVTSLDHPRRCI